MKNKNKKRSFCVFLKDIVLKLFKNVVKLFKENLLNRKESSSKDLKAIEKRLKYKFKNKSLLELALTHVSFAKAKGQPEIQYERLEFLGDSILAAVLATELYKKYPKEQEGFLARGKSFLGSQQFLTEKAVELNLAKWIKLGLGEKVRISMLSNVLESVIGAMYLDGGFELTYSIVKSWFVSAINTLPILLKTDNPKGRLQELFPQSNFLIEYRSTGTGSGHKRYFDVDLFINDVFLASGQGSSKKIAEHEAAENSIKHLKHLNFLNSEEAFLSDSKSTFEKIKEISTKSNKQKIYSKDVLSEISDY